MMFGWITFALFQITEGISYIIQSQALWQWHNLLLYLVGFWVIIWVDFINRDSIEPIKIALYSIIFGITLHALFFTNSVRQYTYDNGELSYGVQGDIVYWIVLGNLFWGLLWIYYSVKVLKNSPDYLKQYAWIMLLGASISVIFPQLMVYTRLTNQIPGIDSIGGMVGISLMTYVFLRKPQLGYVLPFKVQKIAVVGSTNHYLLYLHKWTIKAEELNDSEEIEDALFSGLLYGISLFVKKSLQSGEVREIATHKSVLIVHHHSVHPLMFVLLTSNATRSLRTAFKNFVDNFIKTFEKDFYKQVDEKMFNRANDFIDLYFPFVPYHVSEVLAPKDKLIADKSKEPDIVQVPKICISCKRVGDLEEKWNKIENYVHNISGKQLSWDVCPICQKTQNFLSLSYFDELMGPTVLLFAPEEDLNKFNEKISRILDLNNEGFFFNTIGDEIVANLQFGIPSQKARGGEITILISFIKHGEEIRRDFAQFFLEGLRSGILALKDLDQVFIPEDSHKKETKMKQLKEFFLNNFNLISEKQVEFYLSEQLT